jgi:hypothetical protein
MSPPRGLVLVAIDGFGAEGQSRLRPSMPVRARFQSLILRPIVNSQLKENTDRRVDLMAPRST